MLQYGLTVPYFTSNEPIALEVVFVLPRRRMDLAKRGGRTVVTQTAHTFPRIKDVDNLLKFVMDALQSVLYANDDTITKVVVSKTYSENADALGWTEVCFGTSSEVPSLATGVWV